MTAPEGRELHPCGRFEWERVIRRIRRGMTRDLVFLALLLATYADPDGTRVRPGPATVAEILGCSERTARRLIAALVDLGLLELVRRGSGGGRAGKRKPMASEYRLTLPSDLLEAVELAPVERRHHVPADAVPDVPDDADDDATRRIAPATASTAVAGANSDTADCSGQTEHGLGRCNPDGPEIAPATLSTPVAGAVDCTGQRPPSDLQRSATTSHLQTHHPVRDSVGTSPALPPEQRRSRFAVEGVKAPEGWRPARRVKTTTTEPQETPR